MPNEMTDKELWQPRPVTNNQLEKFATEHPGLAIIDEQRNNLQELFLLRHPPYRFAKNYQAPLAEFLRLHNRPDFGSWFYFPWLNSLIRYLPEDWYLELRTGRNKNLITNEEQNKFYHSTIACLGLSVGSHVAAEFNNR